MTSNHDIKDLSLACELSKSEQDFLQTTRRFCQTMLEPKISQAYKDEKFPRELVGSFASEGLLGAQLSGYGLRGVDYLSYGLIMREVERVDSGFRSFLSVHSSLAMYAIWRYGSEEQKACYLPDMGKGLMIGSFALTEPHGGSDPSNMKTTAEKLDSNRWRINGFKRWVTNAPLEGVCVVWAMTNQGAQAFIVNTKSEGFKVHEIKDKLSLRASASSQVEIVDLVVDESDRLVGVKSLGSALDCLNQARYGIIWGVLGAAEACLEAILEYAKNRELFGRSLSSFQLSQLKFAQMFRDLKLAQLYACRLAIESRSKKLAPWQISLGKMNNVEIALKIARTCREMMGANGILLDRQVMRHLCNLETVYTYEGTHEIHSLVVAHELTGEAAFKS